MRTVKIKGSRGAWSVDVEGTCLASLHSTFLDKATNEYVAPSNRAHKPGGKRYQDFVLALENSDLVVIQKDADPTNLKNDGYIGVFRFSDLKIDNSGIRLRTAEQVADRER